MKYALASQRKKTNGWCVKHWQQTVNNRNHWQVDDGWSTAAMFVTFPKNWHSIKKQNKVKHWRLLSPVVTLLIYCNFAAGFGKSLIFRLFCEVKLASNQNSSCCRAKQHRGRSHQCKMGLTGLHYLYGSWHLYICRFRFGLSTFYVASLLFMKGTSCCVIRRS